MKTNTKAEQLIIPVYINEKIVLDMLAIIEDGFSKVSQISYNEQSEKSGNQRIGGDASTSVSMPPLLGKLLKIDLRGEGEFANESAHGEQKNTSFEKVHTNVSLLSKFRTYLIEQGKCLKTKFDVSKMQIGDFIELDGELQKNPLIQYLDSFINLFRMGEIFTDEPELGRKKKAKQIRTKDQQTLQQIKSFRDELEQSGTTDFILTSDDGTVVLSVQNQYLTNDNISEILGGRFKVLGKVIAVCKTKEDTINLLRKTTLHLLSKSDLQSMIQTSMEKAREQLNLPALVTEIQGPAIIVIPIAIYA